MSLNDSMVDLENDKRPLEEGEQNRPAKRRSSSVNHQRALKACEACRKGKTKCFKTSSVAVRCVRCTSSKLVCSLETEYKLYNPTVKIIDGVPEHLLDTFVENASFPPHFIPKPGQTSVSQSPNNQTNHKLDLIYRGISDILTIITSQSNGNGSSPLVNGDVKLLLDAANSMKRKTDPFTPSEIIDTFSHDSLSALPSGVSRFGLATANTSHLQEQAASVKAMDTLDNDQTDSVVFSSSSSSFKISPLCVISHSMDNVPSPIANLLNLSTLRDPQSPRSRKPQYDIVTCGVLSENEAIALMDDFRSNYGRWVSFPIQISTKNLVSQIRRKSSLLLSTCCSLSLRYSLNGKPSPGDLDSHRRKKDTYRAVLKHLVNDLNKSLLKYAAYQGSKHIGEDVEFLQSMVILSIYSLSLSSIVSNTVDPESLLDEDSELRDLNLDPWYLSGLALSTFISKSTFGSLFHSTDDPTQLSPPYIAMYDELTTEHSQLLTLLRIYNHLVLIHLVSCVLSGRMCMVDEIRLNHCTSTLSLPSATNFDGRMVSEIGILLITYNFIQINSNLDLDKGTEQLEASLQAVNADFQAWHDQWGYLFEQPALQFGEFCFNFCDLQIVYNYVFYKARLDTGDLVFARVENQSTCGTKNLMTLLEHASDTDLSRILLRSYNLTHFVTKVDNDSYFAYLSDQLHFFFFYGAMSLIMTLKSLSNSGKLYILAEARIGDSSDCNLRSILSIVDPLIEKFSRVAQENPNDIITKYKAGICECLALHFPTQSDI